MIELAAAAAAKSPSAWDQPGTLGFLVVFGMAVILFFVFRSLSRHLRKINEAARLEALQAESAQPDPGLPGSPEYSQPGDGHTRSDYERQQSEASAASMDADF